MAQPLPTLNLLGAGRVGQTLAHLWARQGMLRVQDVLTRSTDSAQAALAFIEPDIFAARAVAQIADMRPADLWLLAVPDAHIAACAQVLAANVRQRADTPALAFHCSGAQSAERARAASASARALALAVATQACSVCARAASLGSRRRRALINLTLIGKFRQSRLEH